MKWQVKLASGMKCDLKDSNGTTVASVLFFS